MSKGMDIGWDIVESRKNLINRMGMGLCNVRYGMKDVLRMDRSVNFVW